MSHFRDFSRKHASRSCVAWSPDGNRIVTSSGDYTIRVWVVRLPEGLVVSEAVPQRIMHGHRGWVLSCCFSPLGDRIATSSADKTILLWDPITFQAVERIQLSDWVEDCAYVPAKKLKEQLTAVGHFVDVCRRLTLPPSTTRMGEETIAALLVAVSTPPHHF